MLGCRKHAIRLLTDRARCVGAERFIFLSGLGLLLNVADQGNHTARLVRMEGKVSTRCRNGTAGYADGAGAGRACSSRRTWRVVVCAQKQSLAKDRGGAGDHPWDLVWAHKDGPMETRRIATE